MVPPVNLLSATRELNRFTVEALKPRDTHPFAQGTPVLPLEIWSNVMGVDIRDGILERDVKTDPGHPGFLRVALTQVDGIDQHVGAPLAVIFAGDGRRWEMRFDLFYGMLHLRF